MDILTRLDNATTALLEENRRLRGTCDELLVEKQMWHKERQYMLSEIERILGRIDEVSLEES